MKNKQEKRNNKIIFFSPNVFYIRSSFDVVFFFSSLKNRFWFKFTHALAFISLILIVCRMLFDTNMCLCTQQKRNKNKKIKTMETASTSNHQIIWHCLLKWFCTKQHLKLDSGSNEWYKCGHKTKTVRSLFFVFSVCVIWTQTIL